MSPLYPHGFAHLGSYDGKWSFFKQKVAEGWYLDVDLDHKGELMNFYPPFDEQESYEEFYVKYAAKNPVPFAKYFGEK